MKRAFLLLCLAGAAAFAQSPSALQGWGLELSPADGRSRAMGEAGAAIRSDKDYDPRLPARSVFATVTTFDAQISGNYASLSEGDLTGSGADLGIRRLTVSLPLKRYGHFGAAYWQRFDRTFEWTRDQDSNYVVYGQGGAFEGILTYAVEVPWVRGLALGGGYHRLLGADRVYAEESWNTGDEADDYVRRDSVEVRREGGYWSVDGYFTKGDFDLGGWFDFSGDVKLSKHRGATDQLFDGATEVESSLPWGFGAAAAWRATARQTLSLQGSYAEWSGPEADYGDVLRIGAGWQRAGKGDRYDRLWTRTDLRFGGYTEIGGAGDARTVAATAGLGIPLGNLGSVDLSTQLGRTVTTSDGTDLEDTFLRLYVSLQGGSIWGQSQRRRR